MNIYPLSPKEAPQWIKKSLVLMRQAGLPLFAFNLLCLFIMAPLFMLFYWVPVLGFLLLFVLPVVLNLLLFNACYGVWLNGRFALSDTIKKLNRPESWRQLLLMIGLQLLVGIVLYLLSFITGKFLHNLLLTLFTLLSIWVIPLIIWGEQSAIQAYRLSIRASVRNALPLLLWLGLNMALLSIVGLLLFGIVGSLFFPIALFVIAGCFAILGSVLTHLGIVVVYLRLFFNQT